MNTPLVQLDKGFWAEPVYVTAPGNAGDPIRGWLLWLPDCSDCWMTPDNAAVFPTVETMNVFIRHLANMPGLIDSWRFPACS